MTDMQLHEYLSGTCRKQMERRLLQLGIRSIPGNWKDILEDEGLIKSYIMDFRQMCGLCILSGTDVMGKYDRLVFEAGQGLLLDRCRREYGCHTTPSNTGIRNPAALLREYMHN